MKKITQIVTTIAVFLVTQTIAFAQLPTDFGSTSNQNDTNQTDAPIDSYVSVLIMVGLGFVFSKLRTRIKA
jgi:hypothetical protein